MEEIIYVRKECKYQEIFMAIILFSIIKPFETVIRNPYLDVE